MVSWRRLVNSPSLEEQNVYQLLQEAILEHKLPMTASWTDDLPAEHHFRPCSRIGSIMLMADPVHKLELLGSYLGRDTLWHVP